MNLFRSWIFAETAGFAPSNIVLFEGTGEDLVDYGFASDLSSWQVAVSDELFQNASPEQALAIGEAIIEIAHMFAESLRHRSSHSRGSHQ